MQIAFCIAGHMRSNEPHESDPAQKLKEVGKLDWLAICGSSLGNHFAAAGKQPTTSNKAGFKEPVSQYPVRHAESVTGCG
jgi:hypothetical protein